MEFYKEERSRFEKSRGIQWKFDVTFWGLIVAATAFFDKNNLGNYGDYIGILSLNFLFVHFLFAYYLQIGLAAARKRSDDVLKVLNSSKNDFIEIPIKRPYIKLFTGDWQWIFFQITATALLLSVFYISVSAK